MRRRSVFLLAAVALAAAGHAFAASEPWPELPMPPRAQVQWVGDSMRINGIPTRILRFESSVSREEIVEFYRAHWAAAPDMPPPAVNEVDDAIVVGQGHGPYFMTAKVRSRGREGSEGLLSVARIKGHKAKLDAGEITVMPNAKILSVVESDDPGRTSRQIVTLAPAGVESVRRFYDTALKQRGWIFVQEGGPQAAATQAAAAKYPQVAGGGPTKGYFAIYQRALEELQLSAVPGAGGRTFLVANLVKREATPELTR